MKMNVPLAIRKLSPEEVQKMLLKKGQKPTKAQVLEIEEASQKLIVPDEEMSELSKEINKGIDDVEKCRVTTHEVTMKILTQQYKDYISQNP